MNDLESIVIRRAERKDLNEIVVLWWELSVNDEALSIMPYLRDKESCMKECLENHNRSFDWGNTCYIVAEQNRNIVGYLIGNIVEAPQKNRYHRKANLENVIVKRDFHRAGIATLLCKEFEVFAIKNNAEYMEVSPKSRNLPAIKLYKKLGFEENNVVLQKKL